MLGIISGAVAGLVAITPASGFVIRRAPWSIGLVAGVVCFWGATGLKHALGYDDSLDAFGVHGVGGFVGAILTGVFAVEAIGGDGKKGLIDGNAGQVLIQLWGCLVCIAWCAVVTFVILKIIDVVIGAARHGGGGSRRPRHQPARRDRALSPAAGRRIRRPRQIPSPGFDRRPPCRGWLCLWIDGHPCSGDFLSRDDAYAW